MNIGINVEFIDLLILIMRKTFKKPITPLSNQYKIIMEKISQLKNITPSSGIKLTTINRRTDGCLRLFSESSVRLGF